MYYSFVLSRVIRSVCFKDYDISYFQTVKLDVVTYDDKVIYVKIWYHAPASNNVEWIELTKREPKT
jgi:hypothetical protein